MCSLCTGTLVVANLYNYATRIVKSALAGREIETKSHRVNVELVAVRTSASGYL